MATVQCRRQASSVKSAGAHTSGGKVWTDTYVTSVGRKHRSSANSAPSRQSTKQAFSVTSWRYMCQISENTNCSLFSGRIYLNPLHRPKGTFHSIRFFEYIKLKIRGKQGLLLSFVFHFLGLQNVGSNSPLVFFVVFKSLSLFHFT